MGYQAVRAYGRSPSSHAGATGLASWPFSRSSTLETVSQSWLCLLAAAGVAYFIPQSASLWHHPLYAGVGARVKMLANRIPADALVLLSDAEAGTQLQIPLQYSEGRPTLMVPLEAKPGSAQWVVLTRYLERQLGTGRKVFAVFRIHRFAQMYLRPTSN